MTYEGSMTEPGNVFHSGVLGRRLEIILFRISLCLKLTIKTE